MMKKKVRFSTLGCRLNQYETQAMREQFRSSGYEETNHAQDADVFVLNTCTVTNESDKESRYLIRKFHRENPNAKIVVTGCYVERDQSEIESIEGVTLTVLNREKSELLELLESCTALTFEREVPSKRRFAPLSISEFEGRTRAYVKIQDGCNHACSFCKVVLARGPARSRLVSDIVSEVQRLTDNGYQEVVLTGVQLGAFGYDLERRNRLSDLMYELDQITHLKRIRLSSIEPTDVTDDVIEALAVGKKMCPHLHIPLQSGANDILARMNRRYDQTFYIDLIDQIRSRVDNFVLTADVMVGFPGETDSNFHETLQVLEKTLPYKLHIFPYSAREGTRASRLGNAVSCEMKKQRKKILYQLEHKLRKQVLDSFVGHSLDLLVEESGADDAWAHGRSSNFVKVSVMNGQLSSGQLVYADITQVNDDALVGRLVSR
jgi:threonylcarbamoyladenosine tRNA methylthiotransferase MtaB